MNFNSTAAFVDETFTRIDPDPVTANHFIDDGKLSLTEITIASKIWRVSEKPDKSTSLNPKVTCTGCHAVNDKSDNPT